MKALTDLVWPFNPETAPLEIAPEEERPDRFFALLRTGDGVPAAFSESFSRRVLACEGREIVLLALASVCVHPGFRGRGWGAAVVRAQFARVDRGEFPLSLFQTAVPDFYRKLGAETVGNRFRNSLNSSDPEKSPFWDKCVMCYPAGADWPDGVVDLMGTGY